MSRISEPQPWLFQIPKGTPALVSCVSVLFTSGPLARPCLGLLQASNQAGLHLTSKSSLITTSVTGKHIKNIKHIKPS